jgi:transposase
MQKKYIVRLCKQERNTLREVVKKLKGSGQKVRRVQILLKADADGPAWSDSRIAEAFGCRRQTVEGIRQRFVESGFQETLEGKKRANPPSEKLLDGKQEAEIIATRLGPPPKGYANWTLRLLAREVVALEIVDEISYETVRRTLKKWDDESKDRILGHSAGSRRRICGQHGRGA